MYIYTLYTATKQCSSAAGYRPRKWENAQEDFHIYEYINIQTYMYRASGGNRGWTRRKAPSGEAGSLSICLSEWRRERENDVADM